MNIGTLTGTLAIEDQLSGQLQTITSKVKRFVSEYNSDIKTLVGVTAAFTAAVTGAVVSIVKLGEKGSTILGVEEAFDRLAEAAGSSGEAMASALNEGVKGTVDSMELMQATTRLLSSGVKVTTDDLNLMAKTAREMGKASGTDAANGLNILSQAIATGNTRSLKRFGIQVDLVAAERQFRQEIGNTTSELTAAGRLEVNRIAALDAMRQRLQLLGESQLSFKERVQQASVAVGNWFDNLAKGIAKSTAVNRAFDSITKAFSDVFGGTAQTVLQQILKWVDQFADAVGSLGPKIIGVFGNIRDRVVLIWHEIVAFNDRWQITNNLIAGARIAWSVLTKAFELVEMAVHAVIRAWNQMPEWLQRITRNALEASVAMAAYSVAIQGVAVPLRALVGTIDLSLNVLSNALGAVYNITQLYKGWTDYVNNVRVAYENFRVALIATTAYQWASSVATKALAEANLFLGRTSLVTSDAFLKLSKMIGLTTAVEWLSNAASKALTVVKGYLAAAVLATSTGFTALTTRILASNIALGASMIASRLATVGITGLGLALMAIQSIPIVAALVGIVAGLNEIKKAWDNLDAAHKRGQSTMEFLTARDTDTWVRRWINYASQFALGVDVFITKMDELEARRKRGTGAPDVQQTISPGFLAPGSSELQAARAERERLERRKLGIGVIDDPESAMVVDEMAERIKNLQKSWAQAGMEAKAFTTSFERLTPVQRANLDVQALLVPEINKLIAANKAITPAMQEVLNAEQQRRLSLLETNRLTLESSNLTLTSYEAMRRAGQTELDIARSYDVTTEALGLRITKMKEAEQAADNLQSFFAQLQDQEAKDRERKEALEISSNTAIANAERELNDLLRRESMTTADQQIENIRRGAEEQIASFEATGARSAEHNRLIRALAEEQVRRLKTNADDLERYSQRSLQQTADRARETYLHMATHPEQYSKKTIAQFKKISEAAQREADNTRSAWETTYAALGAVNEILDNISGTFAEVASVGVRTAQQVMKAWESGDWISMVTAGVTGIITVFKKLIGATRDGRNEVVKFAESFDTIAPGTGFDELHRKLLDLGPAGETMWVKLTQGTPAGNKEAAERNIKEVQASLEALASDIQKYSLSWTDLANKQTGSTKAATDLVTSYKRLTDAGYDQDKVLKAMGGDLNSYITSAIRAGTKIPPAMQSILEKFIRMNGLTKDAADALMGLSNNGVPSLDAIREAAGRYGIELESLGGKVMQLQITELADQYVSDWQILTAATDNWGVVMEKMGPKVQDLVTDALKFGSQLPATMRPMIEAFINAGQLVDENGEKLTDLSQLNWATPIEEMFETLITKLDEFIDKLASLNGMEVSPTISPRVNQPDLTYHSGDIASRVTEPAEPSYYATGTTSARASYYPPDTARGNVVNFAPRGTDTIPAMLTPGERVIPANAPQTKVVIELDRRWLADILVPEIPGAVKRAGIR